MEPSWPTSQQEACYDYKKRNYARFSIWSPLCRYQVHCKQSSVKLLPTVKWLTMHLNYLSMWLHNSEHFLPQIACNNYQLKSHVKQPESEILSEWLWYNSSNAVHIHRVFS